MIRIKEFNYSKISQGPFPFDIRERLLNVDIMAKKNGWQILMFHSNNYIVNLARDGVKMNIYLSTMTVQTAMHHPKKGKTQLNRKNLSLKQIESIFKQPRQHTGKGYYYK